MVCSKLRQIFHKEIHLRDIFACPTSAALANRIHTLQSTEEDRLISNDLTTSGSTEHSTEHPELKIPSYHIFNIVSGKPWLFCLPMSTGLGTVFANLAMATDHFSVLALNDPFLRGEGPTSEKGPSSVSLKDLAEIYYRQITDFEKRMKDEESIISRHSEQLTLNILGYSFGDNVATEVAHQARCDKRKVNIFVIDSANAVIPTAQELAKKTTVPSHPEEIEASIQATLREAVEGQTNRVLSSFADSVKNKDSRSNQALIQEDILRKIRECAEANIRRLTNHRMTFYPGHVTMFRSEFNSQHGLHDKVQSLEEIVLHGSHSDVLEHSDAQLREIMEKISKVVNEPSL